MPTRQGTFAPQAFQEMYGEVVGLYGDPANQVPANQGVSIGEAFTYIGGGLEASTLKGNLFWSRTLLVELLVPNDTAHFQAGLVLVARPRTLWLFEKDSNTIADFVGNTVNKDYLGQSGHTEIVEVTPPYRKGDIIRIGTLPAPITISDFSDGFTRRNLETYDGTTGRYTTVDGAFTNVSIAGATYNSALYSNFATTKIIYYDKNVDGRSRIVGKADESGNEIIMKVCVGGVVTTYKVKGTRIA